MTSSLVRFANCQKISDAIFDWLVEFQIDCSDNIKTYIKSAWTCLSNVSMNYWAILLVWAMQHSSQALINKGMRLAWVLDAITFIAFHLLIKFSSSYFLQSSRRSENNCREKQILWNIIWTRFPRRIWKRDYAREYRWANTQNNRLLLLCRPCRIDQWKHRERTSRSSGHGNNIARRKMRRVSEAEFVRTKLSGNFLAGWYILLRSTEKRCIGIGVRQFWRHSTRPYFTNWWQPSQRNTAIACDQRHRSLSFQLCCRMGRA